LETPLDTHLAPSSHPRPQSFSLLVDTMLELTYSFDAPLEANRVSSEDTQAQLDEFRQMPWIKPDYKTAALDALRKVERYWRRYSPSDLHLQPGCVQANIFC
jgi:hypothetical protein